MERITNDDQRGGAAGVRFALVAVPIVTVAPQHQLLEEEKGQDAGEQRRHRDLRRQGRQGLREQCQQRHSE